MRLATFNIQHGRSVEDGKVDPQRLGDAAAEIDADVLGLQEVDVRQPRSHGADLTAVAADAMGARWYRFAPAISGTPGSTWTPAAADDPPDRPAYGVALCSRLPVRSWQLTRLPALPVKAPVRVSSARRQVLWIRDEPRVALTAVVDTPAGALPVTVTHLSFLPLWNVVQLAMLRARLRRLGQPRILLGDLNLPGGMPAHITGMRPLARGRTFPVGAPTRQIDHILAAGPLPPVTATATLRLPVSDHLALTTDLDGSAG